METSATEQQAYEVPGQQLRWRASQLNAQGYPFQVQPAAGGVYIVIVQQPSGVNPFAYQPPPRQAWPVAGNVIWLRISIACAVGAVLCGLLYLVFSRAAGIDAAPATAPDAQTDSAWDWLPDLRLPWDAEPERLSPPTPTPAPGWQWPWDAASQNMAAAADSAQATVTAVSAAILIVLVLLIVLALVRRKR